MEEGLKVNLELILFDADRTLLDYDRAESDALRDTFCHFGLEYDEDIHQPLYREINEGLWRELEKGTIATEELRIKRFEIMLDGKMPEADLGGFSRLYLTNLSKGSYLIDGAEEVCRHLADRYRLAVVTNGIREVQLARFKGSPIEPFIEHVIISEDAGYSKPHPGIFEYAFRILGHSNKETAIMVGDSLIADIAGGLRFGIKTCWYNPAGCPVVPELEPGYEIADLRELLTLMEISQPPIAKTHLID
jgi:2-haloacid dehalogenase